MTRDAVSLWFPWVEQEGQMGGEALDRLSLAVTSHTL